MFRQQQWREQTLQRLPLGRFGRPEDLVCPALLLASDAGGFSTGQLLTVDAGWTSS